MDDLFTRDASDAAEELRLLNAHLVLTDGEEEVDCIVCYDAQDNPDRKLGLLRMCSHRICDQCARACKDCPLCRNAITGGWVSLSDLQGWQPPEREERSGDGSFSERITAEREAMLRARRGLKP